MTPDDTRLRVLQVLKTIAPEADPETLRGEQSLRDQLDVDSMDMLNFAIGISKEFGIAVPDADYSKLTTIDRCVEFVLAAKATPA
jgi:acyl carrier protein